MEVPKRSGDVVKRLFTSMCEQAEERAKRKALRKEWNILWTAVADNDIEQTEAQTKSNVARSDIDVV